MNIVEVTEDNVADYFKSGKNTVVEEERKKREEEIISERNKQQKEIEANDNKFMSLYGREKRIQMLNDQLAPLVSGKEAMKKVADIMILSAHQEKELDWASMGGFASAIGGTGAGISVAVDAQRQNETIRARNAANKTAVVHQAMSIEQSSHINDEKIKTLEEELKRAHLALVDDKLNSAELFDNMVYDYKVTTNSIGVLTVSSKVKLKNEFQIFNVDATIDGMLKADITVDEEIVRTVIMVLPCTGVYSSAKTVQVSGKALIPYSKRNSKNVTVSITPLSLWAMERA